VPSNLSGPGGATHHTGVYGGRPQDPTDACGGSRGGVPRGGGPHAGAVDVAGEGGRIGGVESVHSGGHSPGSASGGSAGVAGAESLLLLA
jgi:hypothetical protein